MIDVVGQPTCSVIQQQEEPETPITVYSRRKSDIERTKFGNYENGQQADKLESDEHQNADAESRKS